MRKSEYLADPTVAAFLEYLRACINGKKGSFDHYIDNKQIHIKNLHDAFTNYKWNRKNYKENDNELTKLRKEVQKAKNDYQVLIVALKILEWGQVYRHTVGWLAQNAENNNLRVAITRAKNILDSDDDSELNRFERNDDLRSDSSTTKIYSLASKRSIIYDNRIGAALARIAREFLERRNCKGVHPLLDFMVNRDNTGKRDPSTEVYRFQKKSTGFKHALSNLRANWLLQKVVSGSTFNWTTPAGDRIEEEMNKLRAIEAALFMVGDDIRGMQIDVETRNAKPCPFSEDFTTKSRPIADRVYALAEQYSKNEFSARELFDSLQTSSLNLDKDQISRNLRSDSRYARLSKGIYIIRDDV